jgi:ribosomal protein L37AE/L43A
LVETKKLVKRRTIVEEKEEGKEEEKEEEEVGAVEEGAVACEYCGGELREEFGVFKCASCGKEAKPFLKKELEEKRVSPAELKDFGAKIKALSLPELADFCLRLLMTAYGYSGLLEKIRKEPERYGTTRAIETMRGGVDLSLTPVTFVKDAGTVFVHIVHEKCWRLYYCSSKPISKQEAEDVLQTAKKTTVDLIFLVAFIGVEKGVEELLEDYKDAKIITAQELFSLSREHDVKLKTVNPAIRSEIPGPDAVEELARGFWKLFGI